MTELSPEERAELEALRALKAAREREELENLRAQLLMSYAADQEKLDITDKSSSLDDDRASITEQESDASADIPSQTATTLLQTDAASGDVCTDGTQGFVSSQSFETVNACVPLVSPDSQQANRSMTVTDCATQAAKDTDDPAITQKPLSDDTRDSAMRAQAQQRSGLSSLQQVSDAPRVSTALTDQRSAPEHRIIEPIPPMPLKQKIIIVVIALLFLIAIYYIFTNQGVL